MEKWTLIEAQSQYCTRGVVGRPKEYWPPDPLEQEWTEQDVQAGRCLAEELGTSRFPPRVALAPPEGWEPPDTSPPTADELNMVALIRDAFNHVGGVSTFKKEAAKNPGELYRAMLKMGVAQVAKEQPKTLPDMDDLTDEDIATMSTADLKRIFLKGAGVTKKSQISD